MAQSVAVDFQHLGVEPSDEVCQRGDGLAEHNSVRVYAHHLAIPGSEREPCIFSTYGSYVGIGSGLCVRGLSTI